MAKKQATPRAGRPPHRPGKTSSAQTTSKSLKNKKVNKTARTAILAPKVAKKRAAASKPTQAGQAVIVAKKKKSTRSIPAKETKAARKTPTRAKPVAEASRRPPEALQRPRRRLPEAADDDFVRTGDTRLLNSARAGRNDLLADLHLHTESSPVMTAGDLDANWRDAYAQGDESPGGDNPTPGQDRVDDIGRALGIVYDDAEELMGGEEITKRDEHRWELNPASREPDEDEDE